MAGRPRSFDRATALSTAMEQFWRQGYDATTVAGLTEAMGITPPSLYAAFGDKDALYGEAVSCYAGRLSQGLEEAMDQPTAREALCELLTRTAAAHTDPATPLGCFLLTEPRLEPEREEIRNRIAARIECGIRQGDVDANVDAYGVAAYVLAVLGGMSAAARDGLGASTVDGIARLATAALPAALSARRS